MRCVCVYQIIKYIPKLVFIVSESCSNSLQASLCQQASDKRALRIQKPSRKRTQTRKINSGVRVRSMTTHRQTNGTHGTQYLEKNDVLKCAFANSS